MTPRERFLGALLFEETDRIPFEPGGPRESTLRAWHAQGLPEGVPWPRALCTEIGIPSEAFTPTFGLPVNFRLMPEFEEKILEHRDGVLVVRDWMGAVTVISDQYDPSYIRAAKDFVTRHWLEWPVKNRQDWIDKIHWRYDPNTPGRFPADFAERCRRARLDGRVLSVSVNGPFWQMREWCGFEGLCTLFCDAPELVHEMCRFWADFVRAMLQRILEHAVPDILRISEDMAFKCKSMISPRMVREFLVPVWTEWADLMRGAGCRLIDMDSDGYIGELIPLWIESGINVCDPIEVAAGNDIVEYRRRFGKRMAYRGGVDKRAIARSGEIMEAELERLRPVVESGGYIPGCDHGVPPDISWPAFLAYARKLAQLTRWL